ncbi:DNA polymerase nu [Papilio machaon]|uniref:DNA polymerase nu n=1 Tax=Papilio machaon TaxID=76193 RepID=UPI001E6651DC|nr:DNA polymerase nu [Papilio machaon]
MAARKYEKHLSVFGRKVLKALVQQNIKDDILNNRNHFNRSSTRPHSYTESSNENNVVDFINYNSSNECANLQNRDDSTITNTVSIETPSIPKSNELVKCVDEDGSPQIAHPNMTLNSCNNDIVPVPPVSSLLKTADDEVLIQDSKYSDHAEEVPWDDMFDTELLLDINNTENDTYENYRKASKPCETEFPIKPVNNNNDKEGGTKISKKRVKKYPVVSEDGLPKKIKKVSEVSKAIKPNFRKQKYSKTVKKWLNDVDPANPVDDTEVAKDANENAVTEKINSFEITATKITEGSKIRKSVQAQLTNKNGIMKYCKPKNVYELNNDDKRTSIIETSTNEEKSVKSKFIPPIKSQIPVKELTYEIATFKNEPSYECLDLFEYSDEEIAVGGSLLDPDNPPNNFTELQKMIGYVAEFTIATECGLQKTAWYLALLHNCWLRLRQSLLDQGLWKVFVDIEMRVLPIISEMERVGVCVNMEKLRVMERLLSERMRAAELACHRAAGRVFQLTSAPQVRAVLYDELQLDSHCNLNIRETICKGAKSTSETMLRSLMNKHPLPKLILEYRHLHKAHSTFILGIAQCVRDGVVTPVWEQNAAATGRIACNTPNLQAVPKTPFSLTLFPEDGAGHALKLRSVYESRAGWRLLAADFRQVECRVLALAAGDTALLAALRSPDLFTMLAATWLGKEEAEVSDEERDRTKHVVYASMYGAGPNKLADVLGLGYERALEVAAGFNRAFPSLKRFGREVVARCERDGTLRTPCGRARHFRDIASPHAASRASAERKAINFVIQGSAADVCKMAMVSSVCALAGRSPALRARLLLQIHDELVWEVRQEHLHQAAGTHSHTR